MYHLRALDNSWHLIYWLNTTHPTDIPVGSGSFIPTHIDYWNMTTARLPLANGSAITGKLHVAAPVENHILKLQRCR